MTRRRLPIGIQTFRKVREDGLDKTTYIRRLLDDGTHFFLSRPRRFGKSRFLDTLKELFEGNEPLSEGLVIHYRWGLAGVPSRAAPELRQRSLQGVGPSARASDGAIGCRGTAGGRVVGVRSRRGNER